MNKTKVILTVFTIMTSLVVTAYIANIVTRTGVPITAAFVQDNNMTTNDGGNKTSAVNMTDDRNNISSSGRGAYSDYGG